MITLQHYIYTNATYLCASVCVCVCVVGVAVSCTHSRASKVIARAVKTRGNDFMYTQMIWIHYSAKSYIICESAEYIGLTWKWSYKCGIDEHISFNKHAHTTRMHTAPSHIKKGMYVVLSR